MVAGSHSKPKHKAHSNCCRTEASNSLPERPCNCSRSFVPPHGSCKWRKAGAFASRSQLLTFSTAGHSSSWDWPLTVGNAATASTSCELTALDGAAAQDMASAKTASLKRSSASTAVPSRNHALDQIALPKLLSDTAVSPSATASFAFPILRWVTDLLQYRTASGEGDCAIAATYSWSASSYRLAPKDAFAFCLAAAALCASGQQSCVKWVITTLTLFPKPISSGLRAQLAVRP
mmetsp:Transcript_57662/g.153628  ORF Transcript_57662/g.153628 Transcript_57662/m.153628 type:complete len:234 (+) Transcript_57662:1004-1705(+)